MRKLSSQFDLKILKKFPRPLIGIDEVGRGCLAGPVCAGVVILNEENPFDHFQDSKSLKESTREHLAAEIRAHHYFGIGWASVEEIDQVNIRQATFLAMARAVQSLMTTYAVHFDFNTGTLLIDGRDQLPSTGHPHLVRFQQLAVIKGDQHLRSISAASIVAKVARDQMMIALSKDFPDYGFEKHKGYGTLEHRNAISAKLPCIHHRRTFGGVKEHLLRP